MAISQVTSNIAAQALHKKAMAAIKTNTAVRKWPLQAPRKAIMNFHATAETTSPYPKIPTPSQLAVAAHQRQVLVF